MMRTSVMISMVWEKMVYLGLLALITLLLTLPACGGGGSSGSSNPNLSPTADAGTDQNHDEKTLATLDGDGSSDPDGAIVSYLWTQIGGPPVTLNNANTAVANLVTPEVDVDTPLAFRLTVQDDQGATDSDDVNVLVRNVNVPPTADAGSDLFAVADTEVILDGGGSFDSDGTIFSYLWEQVLSPGDPEVTLIDANTQNARFTAPAGTDLLTFRLTVTDNEGAPSNDEVRVSVAEMLFSDDFSDGNANGWNVVDDSGTVSEWVVVNGEYQQQNFVEFKPGSFDESYHIGTYSYYPSGTSWTSYRFSADVIPLEDDSIPQGTLQGNDVGIMFRYQNNSNYYRFSMSSGYGFARLEKKLNGSFSTLAVDAGGYKEQERLKITIEVNGSVIQAYVNDEPLFAVLDSDISSGTIALYCQDKAKFDNVMVTKNSLLPSVVISSPVDYSVLTTDSLNVTAITTNVPSGGFVEFLLDDISPQVDNSFPYSALFSGVPQGEHKLDAIVHDESGEEIVRDTNHMVGVLGDYYVAVGNSITNGKGDNFSIDNISADGRIIAVRGFEANLDDLLTSTLNYPHIVFNEGIGGDTSLDAENERTDSILERHPESNKVLILLGTVDSGAGTSNGDYKSNMQNLIDKVGVGKEVWVALIPPVFNADGRPNTGRNQVIQGYNGVIEFQLGGIQVGPDFFNYFLGSGENRSSLFADTLHPNGLGHAVMAYLWHNKLSSTPLALPMVLENLTNSTTTPLSYKQNLLEVGDKYYIDESFTLTSIPAELEGSVWIMTANGDSANSDLNYISFEVDRDVTVYVAYDAGAQVLPSWLSTFTNTGLQVGTTGELLRLYKTNYPSGSTITLGGNRAGGGTGTSNYVVVVVGD